jgi:lysophospholipase L1-like esterase
MCALSVTSNDSACTFGVLLTQKAACRYVNKVRVYHNFNSSFEFNVALNDSLKVTRTDHQLQGYSLFTFIMPIDSVPFKLVRKDSVTRDFILYGFSMENDMTPGFYLAGLGANGAFSNSFLRCQQLEPQLASLNGDLFILSLGVNDTQSKGFTSDEYIENYDSLITLIKKVSPGAAILLTTTTDNYIRRRTSNKRSIKARDAMFLLMEKHHVAVWDMFTVMGGYRSILSWYKAGMASRDRVHFTSRGYTVLGNLMYEAVTKSYQNHSH